MAHSNVVWRILSLPCEEASRLSSESLDRAIPFSDRLAWKLHLLVCVTCRRYRRDIQTLRRIATRLARPADSPLAHLPEDARAQIKRALKSD